MGPIFIRHGDEVKRKLWASSKNISMPVDIDVKFLKFSTSVDIDVNVSILNLISELILGF